MPVALSTAPSGKFFHEKLKFPRFLPMRMVSQDNGGQQPQRAGGENGVSPLK
jgi:hypothetical protein